MVWVLAVEISNILMQKVNYYSTYSLIVIFLILFSHPIFTFLLLVKNVYVCEYSAANLQMLQAANCSQKLQKARLWHWASKK